MSHFFPPVRGVNKPAAFWDWFIPVITCVFLRCIIKSAGTLSHFSFFLSERRKPSEVPGSTRWSEKYVHQLHPFPRALRPYGPTNRENWNSAEFIRQFKNSELSIYLPRHAGLNITNISPYMLTGNHVQSEESTNIERVKKDKFVQGIVRCVPCVFLRHVRTF